MTRLYAASTDDWPHEPPDRRVAVTDRPAWTPRPRRGTLEPMARLPLLVLLLLCSAGARAEPPLEYVEVLTGGAAAEEPLPLVVAIHGLGDRPEAFSGLVRGLNAKARVIVPRAPEPHGAGGSWYPTRAVEPSDSARAEAIRRSAERIAALVTQIRAAHPSRGRTIVTGFSQGGVLSFVLATRHPSIIALAVPLAGSLPPELVPQGRAPARAPPIVALHGQGDTVHPVGPTREVVERLREVGWDVQLRTWAGVGHTVPGPMREAMAKLLESEIRAQSR